MHRLGLYSFLALSLFALQANAKSAGSHPAGECGTALSRMLSQSEFGTRVDRLGENMKVDTFLVSDVRKSMKIAEAAIASQPLEMNIDDKVKAEYEELAKRDADAKTQLNDARSELKRLETQRESILGLTRDTPNLRKSLDYFNKQISEASQKQERAQAKQTEATSKLTDFLVRNSLVEERVDKWDSGGKYIGTKRLKNANTQRQALEAAIQAGEVADANRRLLQLESDRAKATLPEFDEIVVIRQTSFADLAQKQKAYEETYSALHSSEIADARIKRLEGFLKFDFPAPVKSELETEAARQRKIKESLKPKVEVALRSQKQLEEIFYTWRPITLLKRKGVIVAALRDGSITAGKELAPQSTGFLCKGSDVS